MLIIIQNNYTNSQKQIATQDRSNQEVRLPRLHHWKSVLTRVLQNCLNFAQCRRVLSDDGQRRIPSIRTPKGKD